jgi:hypothetical protein
VQRLLKERVSPHDHEGKTRERMFCLPTGTGEVLLEEKEPTKGMMMMMMMMVSTLRYGGSKGRKVGKKIERI